MTPISISPTMMTFNCSHCYYLTRSHLRAMVRITQASCLKKSEFHSLRISTFAIPGVFGNIYLNGLYSVKYAK